MMTDLYRYCNKVINQHIFTLLIVNLLNSIGITFISGIVLFLIGVLFSEEYCELFLFSNYLNILIYFLIGLFVILFIGFVQFEMRVLIDLKKFVDREKILLISNNRVDNIVNTLDNLCDYIIKKQYSIGELSHKIDQFKKLKYPKEDR